MVAWFSASLLPSTTMADVDVPIVQLGHVIGRNVAPPFVDITMDPVHCEGQSRSAKETKDKAEQVELAHVSTHSVVCGVLDFNC